MHPFSRASIRNLVAWLAEYLFPHAAEKDEGFRLEIQRQSRRSLYFIGSVYIVVVALVYPVLALMPDVDVRLDNVGIIWPLALTAVAALFLFARSRWGLRYARLAALASVHFSTLVSTYFDLQLSSDVESAERYLMADCTGALLIAVVLIPALPLQMFALGLAITATVVAGITLSPWAGEAAEPGGTVLWLVIALTADSCLCALLSGFNYRRLWKTYRSHQEVLAIQRRMLLSENATSLGRLAAAVSHELNNPLGSLKSSWQTLQSVRKRLLTARAGERERLEALADSLDNNVNSSLSRITELVGHMQRFTNLDRAEERHFDVEDLVGDVIELMEPDEKSRVQLDVSSNHLPRVYSRPQQVGAVLSRLISESIQAAPDPTPVRIAVASEDGAVKIVITDQRPSLAPDELRRLFEPDFRVRRGRMAAANWSWFHSREMLRELGGDLAVSSSERTATILSLPAEKPDESASDRNGRDSPTSL